MSVGEHPEGRLVDLALGHLGPRARDDTLTHLAGCPGCRAAYDALARTVEQTLLVGPEEEPPRGFEERTLAALGLHLDEHPSEHLSGRPASAPASRRGQWALVAAATVLGLAVGLTAGRGLGADDPPGDPGTVAQQAEGAVLRTPGGAAVGAVTEAFQDGRPVYVVSVRSARPGASYECRLRLADGRRVRVADWTMRSDRASWVVGQPGAEVREVTLVADHGRGEVWARATL